MAGRGGADLRVAENVFDPVGNTVAVGVGIEITCAPARVRRLMAQNGLRALQPRSFAPKTSDGRTHAPSPNLVAAEPPPTRPHRAWAGDITHIPIEGGWAYLAVVIDLCTRRMVGWDLADNMRAGLVTAALGQGLETTGVAPGIIFHSDRGSQYGSGIFREQLAGISARLSMSGRANPYDNAWTESVIGTIKHELVQKSVAPQTSNCVWLSGRSMCASWCSRTERRRDLR